VLAFGQSASLTGKMVASVVPADPGGVVPGVSIRLESEQDSRRNTSTESDANGNWSLTNLLPGEYTLTASSRGFAALTVRGIKIVGGEQKVLPALRLDIRSSGCGGGPLVQYARLLDGETRTGDFARMPVSS
jgi:Carboxypeptidase regulatory-like domain